MEGDGPEPLDPRCPACGAPLRAGSRFCASCGTGTAPAPASAGPTHGAPVTGPAHGAGGAVATVARASSIAMTAGRLPWQIVTAGQAPDIEMLVSAAGPVASTVVRRVNLRTPALAMIVAAAADLAIAALLGGGGPLLAARAGGAVVTAGLGLLAGRQAGPLRTVAALAALATGVVQVVSLVEGPLGSPPLMGAIAIASGLLTVATTAWGGLRR